MLFGELLKVKRRIFTELDFLNVTSVLFSQKKLIMAVVMEIAFHHKTVFLITYGFSEIIALR